MEEKKSVNWGLIIGIIVATVAVLAAGAFLAIKLLNKKECDCDECELDDCDICVLDDCDECVEVETDAE
ncbi:MAG: Trep_Strep domain-containing protein [Ruminococcaceae bacterium]|nr:Trep_Strep domain-containing protein [Oscillospiraceae bacterium]